MQSGLILTLMFYSEFRFRTDQGRIKVLEGVCE